MSGGGERDERGQMLTTRIHAASPEEAETQRREMQRKAGLKILENAEQVAVLGLTGNRAHGVIVCSAKPETVYALGDELVVLGERLKKEALDEARGALS